MSPSAGGCPPTVRGLRLALGSLLGWMVLKGAGKPRWHPEQPWQGLLRGPHPPHPADKHPPAWSGVELGPIDRARFPKLPTLAQALQACKVTTEGVQRALPKYFLNAIFYGLSSQKHPVTQDSASQL